MSWILPVMQDPQSSGGQAWSGIQKRDALKQHPIPALKTSCNSNTGLSSDCHAGRDV